MVSCSWEEYEVVIQQALLYHQHKLSRYLHHSSSLTLMSGMVCIWEQRQRLAAQRHNICTQLWAASLWTAERRCNRASWSLRNLRNSAGDDKTNSRHTTAFVELFCFWPLQPPPTHGPLRASDPTPMGDDAVMGLKMRRLCIRVHPLSRETHWETLDTNMEIEWVTVWGVRESPEDFRNASSTLLHRSLRSHSSSSRQLELLSFSNPSLLILFLLFSMSPLTLPLSIWREVLCERGIVTINDSNNFLLKFLTRLFFRKGC